ncbi:MAG: hypothetical protein AABY22_13215 [Nanoarchaeota archaeon]
MDKKSNKEEEIKTPPEPFNKKLNKLTKNELIELKIFLMKNNQFTSNRLKQVQQELATR